MLLLLACTFLSKLLAASALWAVAWRGRNTGTAPAGGQDGGCHSGHLLQTLTGELGGSTAGQQGGQGWGEVGRAGRGGVQLRDHVNLLVFLRADRHMREEDLR